MCRAVYLVLPGVGHALRCALQGVCQTAGDLSSTAPSPQPKQDVAAAMVLCEAVYRSVEYGTEQAR